MGKLLKQSNIEVGTIEYKFDQNSEENLILKEWGRNIPVIKIGETILSYGDLIDFNYVNRLNDLPFLRMTLNDENNKIRNLLKNDIDKGVVRMGYKDWALKFDCIFNKCTSNDYSDLIDLTGTIWNEKFYSNNKNQYSYKDVTIQDVLTKVCEDCGIGLYVYENYYLSQLKHEYIINSGKNPLEFIYYLITNYTDNIFSIDGNYFLHVGNIESIRKEELSQYTMNWKTGNSESEKPMIFKSPTNVIDENSDENNDNIYISNYGIESNYSGKYKDTKSEYTLWNEKEKMELRQNDFGIGQEGINTFSGFKNHVIPFYEKLVEKEISGNIITTNMSFLIPELNPFDVIQLYLYKDRLHDQQASLDEVHSGKKVVIGFEISYTKPHDNSQSLYIEKIQSI